MIQRLEIRLTVACLTIIALFLLTFACTWFLLGGQKLLRPPVGNWSQRLSLAVNEAYGEGGWPAVRTALRWSFMPPENSLNLYTSDGTHQAIQGLSLEADPDAMNQAAKAGTLNLSGAGGPEIWICVGQGAGASKPAGFLRLNVNLHRHQAEGRKLAYTLVISSLVASFMAFLAGWWGSRAVARPIKSLVIATHALAESDFHHRITTSGPGELRQLAASFNDMAENLENTIASLTEAKERADRAKEKAERSEASRRQFLADASHNLRTPLAAVLGWIEAGIDGLTPGEEMLHLRNIRLETIYVSQNVQRLLDWSRWEETPPCLVYENFPVSEPLMECVQTLEELAQSREINLRLLGLEGEPMARGDRHRVRELFQLLLENAVQHNPPGTDIEVAFSFYQNADMKRLLVTISDNGKGLPEELAADIESRVGGGLGLAIASRLAQAHGGKLELYPCEKGTRLSFSLEMPAE